MKDSFLNLIKTCQYSYMPIRNLYASVGSEILRFARTTSSTEKFYKLITIQLNKQLKRLLNKLFLST